MNDETFEKILLTAEEKEAALKFIAEYKSAEAKLKQEKLSAAYKRTREKGGIPPMGPPLPLEKYEEDILQRFKEQREKDGH